MTSCGTGNTAAVPSVSITVIPSTAAVPQGAAESFFAKISGSSNSAVIWSVKEGAAGGSVTSSGIYTAPTSPGTYHVIATSQADSTAQAMATITVPQVTISVSPATANLAPGGTKRFTADVEGSVNTDVTWSVQEGAGGGTIDGSGLYTAPATPGTFHVVAACLADPSRTGTAVIGVVELPGTFTAVGSLSTARAVHTATLLPNGKVLIAGGFGDGFQPLASAELYDPSTGTFTSTGDMTTPRARHTAVLLANGKVLIAGGVIDTQLGTYMVSAEIYDPSTGTFAATGNMMSTGRAHQSILLSDGRVFLAQDNNAEIYDPASGTFALTGAYADPGPVWVDRATLLPDGRVLITGCTAQCSAGVNELYSPQAGTFSVTGPRPAWDTISTATLLLNGTVLFVEGNDSVLPDDVVIYNLVTGTFSDNGNTNGIHEFSTATRLVDGTVLVAGGQLAGGDGNPDAELFVPATGTFEFAGNMVTGRHEHTATLLADGTVLIVGGFSVWPTPTSAAEIYKANPSGSSSAPTGKMNPRR